MIRVDKHEIRVGGVGGQAAEPGELRRIELRIGIALDGELRNGALEFGENRTILVRIEVEAVGRDEPAAAGVVLHDDGWVTGNESREMSRHEARRNVIDASRRRAHEHRDGAAAIERLGRLCRSLPPRPQLATEAADKKEDRRAAHEYGPWLWQGGEQIAEAVPRLAHVQPLLNFPNPRLL